MSLFDEYRQQLVDIFEGKTTKFNKSFVQYVHPGFCRSGPCEKCSYNHLRLFDAKGDLPLVGDANHPHCDCEYHDVQTLYADDLVALYLYDVVRSLRQTGKLPEYYITKKVAEDEYGWNYQKNTVAGKAPGKMIGGDIYENKGNRLPIKAGRVWYECDINYQFGRRPSERLFYSSDGLMFYSPDHAESKFYYIGEI